MTTKQTFHARLEGPEGGVYRAIYRGDVEPADANTGAIHEGAQTLPDMHIGTDPRAVITWVEEMARLRGYDTVIWDEDESTATMEA